MTTSIPPPFFWAVGEGIEPSSMQPLAALGHDGARWFYVDGTNAVRATSAGDTVPMFVNSALAAFAEFMNTFEVEWERRSSLSDDEADAQTDRLHQALQRIDPDALSDPSAWWALVHEQMHDGLL